MDEKIETTKKRDKMVLALCLLVGLGMVAGGGYSWIRGSSPLSDEEIVERVEDLESRIEEAREAESEALATSGFSEDFFAAWQETSDLVAEEERLTNAGDTTPSDEMVEETTEAPAVAIVLISIGVVVVIVGVLYYTIERGLMTRGATLAVAILTGGMLMFIANGLGAGVAQGKELSDIVGENPLSFYAMSLKDFGNNYAGYANKLANGGENNFITAKGEAVTIQEGNIGYSYKVASGVKTLQHNCDIIMDDNLSAFLVDFGELYNDSGIVDKDGGAENGRKISDMKVDHSYGGTNMSTHQPANLSDVRTYVEKAAMIHNALMLQYAQYCRNPESNDGIKKTIAMPLGVFYLADGHDGYVVQPVNGVSIEGSGIGQYRSLINNKNAEKGAVDDAKKKTNGSNATILKAYTSATYNKNAAPDVFFFNVYSQSDRAAGSDVYIKNISYKNFIIDSEDAVGVSYSSGGKGFMYNLFENVNWEYVVVMNTDGTGFGVDNPIGDKSYIKHCAAIGNGKKAESSPSSNDAYDAAKGRSELGVQWNRGMAWSSITDCGGSMKCNGENSKAFYTARAYGGASGFGIGTGYSNSEEFKITDSLAYGNTKFGFFYEHQNRFSTVVNDGKKSAYPAIDAKGFSMSSNVSAYNRYNYGGMRANDVTLSNSKSANKVGTCIVRNEGTYYEQKTCTTDGIYFSDDSRDITVSGMTITGDSFADISDCDNKTNGTNWCRDAIAWAVKNGITYGVGSDRFGVNDPMNRDDFIVLIWRAMGRGGEVVSKENGNQLEGDWNSTFSSIDTPFDDYKGSSDTHAAAIRWASLLRTVEDSKASINGGKVCTHEPIVVGGSGGNFNGKGVVTRKDAALILWRLVDKPKPIAEGSSFEDLDGLSEEYKDAIIWAEEQGVSNGIGNNKFNPDGKLTRSQAIVMLYRVFKKPVYNSYLLNYKCEA